MRMPLVFSLPQGSWVFILFYFIFNIKSLPEEIMEKLLYMV